MYEGAKFYLHDIATKYYNTKIALHPTLSLESLPMIVKEKSEGILIQFNPHDVRDFFISIDLILNFKVIFLAFIPRHTSTIC